MARPVSAPAPEPAPRLTKQELADRYGVGLRSVEHWQRAGLPSSKETRSGRSMVVFDGDEADAWVRANRPDNAESEDRAEEKARVELEIAREELRKRRAAADAAERENAVRAGQLLDAEEVRLGRLARIGDVVRILDGVPAALAPVLAHKSPAECREILAREMDRVRREFAREDA